MGIPVWLLTHTTRVYGVDFVTRGEQTAPVVEEKPQIFDLDLTFATVPEKFTLAHQDRVILSGAGRIAEIHGGFSLSIPKEGVDLLFNVKWPANTQRTAVQVTISKKGSPSPLVEKTFWGQGDLVEIITIPGDK